MGGGCRPEVQEVPFAERTMVSAGGDPPGVCVQEEGEGAHLVLSVFTADSR